MPVITPAYPQMCATFNITKSTKTIIQRELERGVELTDKILGSERPWKDLFVKHTFFTHDHKYYLAVIATSTTNEAHKIWSGFVESKVRILVGELERHSSVALARPFNKGFERQHLSKTDEESTEVQNGSLLYVTKDEEDPTDTIMKKEDGPDGHADNQDQEVKDEDPMKPKRIYTTTHYIGLELAEGMCDPRPPRLLASVHACWPSLVIIIPNLNFGELLGAKTLDLSYQVNAFKQMCSEWDKYSSELNFLSVQHVKK